MPIFNLYENVGVKSTQFKTPLPLRGAKWEVLRHCNNGSDTCMQLTPPLYYTGMCNTKHCLYPVFPHAAAGTLRFTTTLPPLPHTHTHSACQEQPPPPTAQENQKTKDRSTPPKKKKKTAMGTHDQSAAVGQQSDGARGLQPGVDKSLIVQLRKSQ